MDGGGDLLQRIRRARRGFVVREQNGFGLRMSAQVGADRVWIGAVSGWIFQLVHVGTVGSRDIANAVAEPADGYAENMIPRRKSIDDRRFKTAGPTRSKNQNIPGGTVELFKRLRYLTDHLREDGAAVIDHFAAHGLQHRRRYRCWSGNPKLHVTSIGQQVTKATRIVPCHLRSTILIN